MEAGSLTSNGANLSTAAWPVPPSGICFLLRGEGKGFGVTGPSSKIPSVCYPTDCSRESFEADTKTPLSSGQNRNLGRGGVLQMEVKLWHLSPYSQLRHELLHMAERPPIYKCIYRYENKKQMKILALWRLPSKDSLWEGWWVV